MNAVLHWLTSPEWSQAVKALLHSLWQGGVLALLLGLALRHVSAPEWRYRLTLGALGGLLLTSLFTWAVLNQTAKQRDFQPVGFREKITPTWHSGPQPVVHNDPLVVTVAAKPTSEGVTSRVQWTAWMALVWLSGALLMLARAGIQVAGAERLRRSTKPLENARIAQLLAEAQRAVRLVRKIRVTVTDTLTSPAVVGVLIPTLILPLSLVTTLTHEQLRFVLLHELAHIRRGDYFANLFQLFVEALLFFNPAVWWISQQVRREREACCDALAIELSGAPAEYARTLVQVAESVLNPSPAAAPAFGNKQREPSSLSDRVQRLLVPGYRPAVRLTWQAMLISLFAGGTLLVLSALGTRTTVGAILANEKSLDQQADAAKTNSPAQTATNAVAGPATLLSTEWDRYDRQGKALFVDTNHAVSSADPTNNVRFNSDNLVQSARLLLEAGKMDEAEAKLKSALEMYPENPAAFYYLSYIKESRYRRASGGQVVRANRDDGVAEDKTAKPGDVKDISQLHTRRFKVDPNTFTKNLEGATAHQARPTNVVAAVRDFFGSFGVELSPPKNVYFNDRAGELFVRATLQDLDVIGEALQALNAPTPQVNIKVRFVEVDSQNGFDWFIGNMLPTATNSATVRLASQFSGILTEPQYRVVLRAMEERKDAKVLAMQEVTTFSGQQAQIQTVELMTVVNGMNLTITARPGHAATNSSTNTAYQTQVLPFGAVLDVIPSVTADGYTIQMTLLPTVTEFLGYDDPAKVLPGLRNRKLEGELPLPRVRFRQMSMSASVWDGQTLFLGTASEEILSKKQDGSIDRSASRDTNKHLLIFITPTIIDPAGNRMHAGDALPIERTSPPQTPGN